MIAPDRAKFFLTARETLFAGTMTQSQVDGVNALMAAWDAIGSPDPRFVAYALATALHETSRTMLPIAEYGHGAGRSYGAPAGPYGHVYYGRGLVQLTWLANYEKASGLLGVDLVKDPDLALQPDIAARIMTSGMLGGWFTGRKLLDYFRGTRSDWIDARRIINGTDKAQLIAGYGLHFLHSMETAS